MGNYEIQAKIDNERHPEWTAIEKWEHICEGMIKDDRKRYEDNKILWITSAGWKHITDTSIYAPYTNGYKAQSFFIDETEPFTITYNESYWHKARPIISPNVFRMEVLGDVRI
jgi:hypothetical protein